MYKKKIQAEREIDLGKKIDQFFYVKNGYYIYFQEFSSNVITCSINPSIYESKAQIMYNILTFF